MDRYAWCFSHGRQHCFPEGGEPWCTAQWVWLEGASEAEALAWKARTYGEARFLHELPGEVQLRMLLGPDPANPV